MIARTVALASRLLLVAVPVSVGTATWASAAPPDDGSDLEIESEVGSGGDVVITEEGLSSIGAERSPLFPVPPGCPPPELATVVFEGRVVETDDRAARFEIEQVRAGSDDGYVSEGAIEVRYGLESQYLEVGRSYLVGAQREPSLGLLYSRVSEPAPLFGGDGIIGLAEIDLECPALIDPVRTLEVDGSPVPTDLVAPLFADRGPLLLALGAPLGIAVGVLFALALLITGVRGLLRAARRGSAG